MKTKLEKLQDIDNRIANGLDVEELKAIKKEILKIKVDMCDDGTEVIILRETLLECVNEMIEE